VVGPLKFYSTRAVAGGANRLEVCGSLAFGGGITPSTGLVLAIQHALPDISLMVHALSIHLVARDSHTAGHGSPADRRLCVFRI
jgi:hypothetical protein